MFEVKRRPVLQAESTTNTSSLSSLQVIVPIDLRSRATLTVSIEKGKLCDRGIKTCANGCLLQFYMCIYEFTVTE